ncbi:Calcium/calmodulin-dependent protein kinase type 1 (CaM kinase I) (MnCaMKI) [Durusdinium trenchii]|uniref:Calcium/calmodulin-dependent protein kinase type 1 (CaM kinase I) (MnCaMKI) n=1 Tax=Durusdinium trenchii TaxID=1381693 RepID=A0ABP0JSL8_9DINO
MAFLPTIDVAELEDVNHNSRRVRTRRTKLEREAQALVGEHVTLEELNHRYRLVSLDGSNKSFPLGEGQVPDQFVIGTGAYGQVCKAQDLTGRTVAIKVVRRNAMALQSLKDEVEALRVSRQHSSINELIEAVHCPDTGATYIVTDFCAGGELFDRLIERGPYKEAEARGLLLRVTSALAHVHACGFAHMDVKPENLLFASPTSANEDVRLIDFGMTTSLESFANTGRTVVSHSIGTTPYLSPEVLKLLGIGQSGSKKKVKKPHEAEVTLDSDPRACDMWALGIILYIILLGCHPFDRSGDASDEAIARRALNGSDTDKDDPAESPKRFSYDIHKRVHLSAQVRDLIDGLLCPDPERRLRAEDVLQHPWLCETVKAHDKADGITTEADAAPQFLGVFRSFTNAHRALCASFLVASLSQSGSTRQLWPNQARSRHPSHQPEQLQRRRKAAARQFEKEAFSVLKSAHWGVGSADAAQMSDVSFDEFGTAVQRYHSRSYAAHETVFAAGEEVDGLYIILEGSAHVEYHDGKVVASLGPGDIFGETAVIDGRDRRNATVRCSEPVRALFWSRDDFVKTLGGTNALSTGLDDHIRARQSDRAKLWMESLGAEQLSTHRLRQGSLVFEQGAHAGRLFLVREGVVSTFVDSRDPITSFYARRIKPIQRYLTKRKSQLGQQLGQDKQWQARADAVLDSDDEDLKGRVQLREFRAGDIFGVDCVAGGARVCTARCETDAQLLSISADDLDALLQQDPSMHNNLLRMHRRTIEEKLCKLSGPGSVCSAASVGDVSKSAASLTDLVQAIERDLRRAASRRSVARDSD